MKRQSSLLWMVPLIALLTAFSAAVGLFWTDAGSRVDFTTPRGEIVQLYGQGLYRLDSVFAAGGFRGTDAVMLFVTVPLLVLAFVLYLRGSLRGTLLQLGVLGFAFYYAASQALGVQYNVLSPLYIALFALSLFAFIIQLMAFDQTALLTHFLPSLPQRAMGIFLSASGVILAVIWLMDLLGAAFQGQVPATLDHYTGVVTYVLDLGIIVPALLVTGQMVRRNRPLGYLLAVVELVCCGLIGLVIIGQTLSQYAVGVVLTPAQMIIFVVSFLIMTAIALWILILFFRSVSEGTAFKGKVTKRALKGIVR